MEIGEIEAIKDYTEETIKEVKTVAIPLHLNQNKDLDRVSLLHFR
jgi:hypothetical protein